MAALLRNNDEYLLLVGCVLLQLVSDPAKVHTRSENVRKFKVAAGNEGKNLMKTAYKNVFLIITHIHHNQVSTIYILIAFYI